MPRAARTAVTAVFFASGASYGSFVARIPALKEKLGAGEAELGLVLFAGAVGSMVVLPLAGVLSARIGSRQVTRAALLAVALCLPLLALAPTLVTFALAFALFGAVTSALDLAMNAHGVEVEARYARPIFSSFHASWSLGGLAGAGAGAAAAARGLSPLTQFVAVGTALLAILLPMSSRLLAEEARAARPSGRVLRRPSGALVALAALAFAALVAEGAAGDWSAVYLDGSVGTSEAVAAGGFAVFAATMTVGRLLGDRLTAAWGPVALTRRAGVLAPAGLATALLVADPLGSLVGFACFGAGLATVIPTVFRAAGLRASSPGAGIAAVSTVGYSAFLIGPPAIGFLAEWVGLRAALAVVVVITALIPLLAGSTRPVAEL